MDAARRSSRGRNAKAVRGRDRKVDRKLEDYAYVIDFLPYGHPEDRRPIHKREPLAQLVGENYFTLLEVSIKKEESPLIMDRLYIGKGERDVVKKIKRKLRYDELTPAAKSELPYVLEHIVKQNEEKFVEFFNRAEPITTRLHQLELLPGIGKKTMWAIIEERKREPFKSFDDIVNRLRITHPAKLIASRIIYELKTPNVKYRIFT
jgi:putative nucleotide binding protein